MQASGSALLLRFRGDILFSVGTGLTSVVAFLGSVVAARFLLPDEMGVMQTLILIPTYCSFLHFGVFNGLNRNIAFYQGKGDETEVQRLVDSSWLAAKWVSLLGFAIGVVILIYFAGNGYSRVYWMGMIFVLFALVAEPLTQHLEVVYLSSRQFNTMGIRLIWQSLLTGIGNALPAFAGVGGFIAGRVIYFISRLALRWPGVPIQSSALGSWAGVRSLAVTGIPLLIAGTMYAFLGVADRSVIAVFMTPKDVGLYTLTGLVVTGTQFVPFCLATLLYPRVAGCYGQTGSARDLRRYFWILLGLTSGVVVPTALISYLLVGPLTMKYLPGYIQGVAAAKITCLSSLSLVYYGVTCIIAVTRRNTAYIAAILMSLLLVWLLGAYFVSQGYGLEGVAWARAIASTILCVFTLVYTYKLTQ